MSVKICCGARWDGSQLKDCPVCGKKLTVDETKAEKKEQMRGMVRAISLWQPWASLVGNGSKTVETRSWKTDYRGKLAIHAAKTGKALTEDYFMGTNLFLNIANALGMTPERMEEELPRGAVVALVDLVDVLPAPEALKKYRDQESFGDFSEGRWAWVFENIRPILPPVEVGGKQGFFHVELEGVSQ